MTGKKPIQSLQGLRLAAFLCIFVNHSLGGVGFGALGVSLFFVLSGFVMSFSYLERGKELPCSFLRNLSFSFKKIRYLYLLHILILFCGLFLSVIRSGFSPDKEHFFCYAANLLLLQAWIPKARYYFSLNGVAWYLSTAVFTYFLFPWVLRSLRKGPSPSRIRVNLASLLLLEASVCLAACLWGNPDDRGLFSQHWITYIFPVARSIDFLFGTQLGYLFRQYRERFGVRGSEAISLRISCLECLSAGLLVCGAALFFKIPGYLHYTAVFLLPASVLICSLSTEKGILSRLLRLPVLQFLGGLTGYAFLIHLQVISMGA